MARVGLYKPETSDFFLDDGVAGYPGGFAEIIVPFGPDGLGWQPISGDFNGDGDIDVGLYNQVNGTFYFDYDLSSGGYADQKLSFGAKFNDWLPVAGDFNGDGKAGVALYDQATGKFYIDHDLSGGYADEIVRFGPAGNDWLPLFYATYSEEAPEPVTLEHGQTYEAVDGTAEVFVYQYDSQAIYESGEHPPMISAGFGGVSGIATITGFTLGEDKVIFEDVSGVIADYNNFLTGYTDDVGASRAGSDGGSLFFEFEASEATGLPQLLLQDALLDYYNATGSTEVHGFDFSGGVNNIEDALQVVGVSAEPSLVEFA